MTISQDKVILFKPLGSIDLQGGMTFSEQMLEVTPKPDQLWVIDLSEVDFMDSSGLVPLINGLTSARECGCRLVLCNVQAPVRLILELTQLDSVFEIFGTYEDIFTHTNEKNLALVS
ncbi:MULTISPECIES: STAS domain-containing protein [Cyanophyceae]|uniref:Anti-sigma factor antagonist n=1 Tax=Nodularia spumigena CENA596 TaxID=1819295 RepID=A0A166JVD3_NODSP|nr:MULTISPECIES: STAS domain-containing protein [Cyanophyceae]MDB9358164.1 STAS domain-containing protein [Nodularia spumigena CS-587/03]KZL50181.1 anti-anti-sigma factor [Nodularia spumigena CENA596]MDB9305301.1 STAS domain-containing protein [Nodularia spumigena CS-591/12]MDB9317213.1 STAS domain-containing protein [Nodularia spumigena CS-590/01A]MDB9322042.1 STAS domain-containing protein [Nodularia spumigena CS-591/07A]